MDVFNRGRFFVVTWPAPLSYLSKIKWTRFSRMQSIESCRWTGALNLIYERDKIIFLIPCLGHGSGTMMRHLSRLSWRANFKFTTEFYYAASQNPSKRSMTNSWRPRFSDLNSNYFLSFLYWFFLFCFVFNFWIKTAELPIRWMAIESLKNWTYTTESDV